MHTQEALENLAAARLGPHPAAFAQRSASGQVHMPIAMPWR